MRETSVLLPVASITLGERRRDEYGDLDGLAESIRKYGLLHPIVVDDARVVIAGGRRLVAVQRLDWETVPARLYGELSDAEKREIELEENLRRKDLTAFEQAKTMVALAETTADVLKHEAEQPPDFSSKLDEKSPAPSRATLGRPSKADSQERVAGRMDVPKTTLHHARQHVETAEQYPFMQGEQWAQLAVARARQHLDKLPEEERPKAAAVVDQPGVPPALAVDILGNVATMPATVRADIYRLNVSEKESERTLALTRAANKPMMPDRRITGLSPVLRDLLVCVKEKDDAYGLRLRAAYDELKAIKHELEQEDQRVRSAEVAAD